TRGWRATRCPTLRRRSRFPPASARARRAPTGGSGPRAATRGRLEGRAPPSAEHPPPSLLTPPAACGTLPSGCDDPRGLRVRRDCWDEDAATARERIEVNCLRRGLVGCAMAALLATAAVTDDTCNGLIHIGYVGAPPVSNIGDTVDVKITLGTGSIQGGKKLTLTSFQFDLDCNADFALT